METEEAEAAPAPKAAPEPEKPNRILFVYGLPGEITDEMLTLVSASVRRLAALLIPSSSSLLFSQYPGFREVRLVPGKTDIAFVEFDSEANSKTAKEVLDGFKVTPKDRMGVSYAKVGT